MDSYGNPTTEKLTVSDYNRLCSWDIVFHIMGGKINCI